MEARKIKKAARFSVCAFSLTEMLVTLLVISLLLAAMTPVMTKKYREGVNISGSSAKGEYKSAGTAILDATGIVESSGNALDFVSGASGVFLFLNSTDKDINIKRLVLQGGGGGGGGFERSNDLGFVLNDQTSINGKGTGWTMGRTSTSSSTDNFQYGWQVPVGVSNVRVSLLGGGGGGGSGYASTSGSFGCNKSKGTCIILGDGSIPAFEMSQYNAGDHTSFPIPPTVARVDPSENCSETLCCWGGGSNTANAGTCKDPDGVYNACTRTMCKLPAAVEICAKSTYDGGGWSLITTAQFALVAALTTEQRTNRAVAEGGSLRLCGWSGDSCCRGLGNACLGAGEGCQPDRYWASVSNRYNVSATLSGPYWTSSSNALATRCVRSLSSAYLPFHGAGGSGGAGYSDITFTNLTPYNSAAKKGDRLLFAIGAGGAGASVVGGNGSDGGQTCVEHQSTTDGVAWTKVAGSTTYCAYGGKGGGGGNKDASSHGARGAVSTCSYSGGCHSGSAGYDWSTNNSTDGGSSYTVSVISGISYGGVGASGVNDSTGLGNSAPNWGAGGAGGKAIDASNYGKGGNGAAGWARVQYQVVGVGSGGGAGGYWESQTITVGAGKSLKITVGKGGNGGGSVNNGIDGGDTYIELDGNEPYRAQGGSGGKIYKNKADASNSAHVISSSGQDAGWANGGNGGVSMSEARANPAALGGCASSPTGNLSFSACNNNKYLPGSVLNNIYYITSATGAGGGGGAGSGCDETSCASGTRGADGFAIISW